MKAVKTPKSHPQHCSFVMSANCYKLQLLECIIRFMTSTLLCTIICSYSNFTATITNVNVFELHVIGQQKLLQDFDVEVILRVLFKRF